MTTLTRGDVTKTFGSQPVLSDSDLQIAQGDFVLCVGPSAIGKSSLFRMIGAGRGVGWNSCAG